MSMRDELRYDIDLLHEVNELRANYIEGVEMYGSQSATLLSVT